METNEDSQNLGRMRRGNVMAAQPGLPIGRSRSRAQSIAKPSLAPLTPGFTPDQHQAYVDHLNAALEEVNVCNIALTGRYGAGKSSVLQEFARQKQKRVLLLSLSTLGPDVVGESRTNQIEKALVKQLLHREKPARLPQSRYQRIEYLPKWRAVTESALGAAAVGVALWLFGVFPHLPGLAGDHPRFVRICAGVVVGVAAVGLLTWVRLAVHNRIVVSAVSAGGASVSLANKSESYFDQYLDEIVYFFESMRRVDIVIFEDLDRFDDPGIFEELRELNTLLNNSKQTDDRTIRFVYALRDSIFEKLGHDTKRETGDAAQAEAVRANRTKFFDLVIPIVPFITHRTSRDLLTQLLRGETLAPVVPVGAELIDLVARHLPDMRLLTNIRNEYAVYATRLITEKRGMDPLAADKLFAMVVYKNIHIADFELVLLGRSRLDSVYRLSRELVTESITIRQARLRAIGREAAFKQALAERAATWGGQVTWFCEKISAGTYPASPLIRYAVGDTEFEPKDVGTERFWRVLLNAGSGVIARFRHRNTTNPIDVTVTMDDLRRLLGVSLLDDWDRTEQEQLETEAARIRADLEVLRTADFNDLAKRADFTLTRDGEAIPFKALLARHIDSEVGRALINEGFIDRYYTLYVAQYYGDRLPPNSMNFIVQNVDTNQPDINYSFNNDDEIAAILRETNQTFLSDVSAYNIGIVDYLLRRDSSGAYIVLDALINHIGEQEQPFLQAYLADGTQATAAVSYLAGRWPAVFTQIVENVDLTRDKRAALVDVALANSNSDVNYELDDAVRYFLQDIYRSLPTVAKGEVNTDDRAGADPDTGVGEGIETDADATERGQVRNAVITMRRAGFVCDDLAGLNPLAIRLVVDSDCYTLSAANLRTALGDPATLSLDRIRLIDASVYEDVIEQPDEYLSAIANDVDPCAEPDAGSGINSLAGRGTGATPGGTSRTQWTVEDNTAFPDVVTDLEHYSKVHAAAVITRAAPDCIINDLAIVPGTTWEALAQCQRFPATLANVDGHITHVGELDADLAAILTAAGSITVPSGDEGSASDDVSAGDDRHSETKVRVAETILKASKTIRDPAVRVMLVSSLDLKAWFPVDRVQPEAGPLLGLLISERICADEPAVFERFGTSDWETLRHAIGCSMKFAEFVTPELLDAATTSRLLESQDVNTDVKQAVLKRFDEFVPTGNRAALSAAGQAALASSARLSAGQINSIAAGTGEADLVVRLLDQSRDSISAAECIAAFSELASPYNEIAASGAKLTFPLNDHHAAVLRRLRDDGRITSKTYPGSITKGPRIEVGVN